MGVRFDLCDLKEKKNIKWNVIYVWLFCVHKNTFFFVYFALGTILEAMLGSVLKHSKLTFLYNQDLLIYCCMCSSELLLYNFP